MVAHIAGDNPAAAARVCAAVLDAADFPAANPGLGKTIGGPGSKHREVLWYVLPRFRSYLLFYVPAGDGVIVIRILHAARDWTRFFSE